MHYKQILNSIVTDMNGKVFRNEMYWCVQVSLKYVKNIKGMDVEMDRWDKTNVENAKC